MVRIDFVRIESNRQVPQTNRLSLGVLDMDAEDILKAALATSYGLANQTAAVMALISTGYQ